MDRTNKLAEIVNVWTPFVFKMRDRMLLKKNLKKQRWRETNLPWLVEHLKKQVQQLEWSVYDARHPRVVAKNAADAANVAMMVADRYKEGAV